MHVLIVTVLVGDFLAEAITFVTFRNGFERVLALRRGDNWHADYDHESILAIPLLDVLTWLWKLVRIWRDYSPICARIPSSVAILGFAVDYPWFLYLQSLAPILCRSDRGKVCLVVNTRCIGVSDNNDIFHCLRRNVGLDHSSYSSAYSFPHRISSTQGWDPASRWQSCVLVAKKQPNLKFNEFKFKSRLPHHSFYLEYKTFILSPISSSFSWNTCS